VFEDAFGIDHERLVAGGRTLLAGRESRREPVCSRFGKLEPQRLLTELDVECESMFKGGRATRPKINLLIAEYRRLMKEIKVRSLAASEWTTHRRAFERKQADLSQLEGEWQRKRTELNRLNRLERSLPKLAERRKLQEQIAD